MKRLFIGGPWDGRWHDIEGDYCRVANPVNLKTIVDYENYSINFDYTEYEAVCFAEQEFKVLVMVPKIWKRKGVLMALLEGYRGSQL